MYYINSFGNLYNLEKENLISIESEGNLTCGNIIAKLYNKNTEPIDIIIEEIEDEGTSESFIKYIMLHLVSGATSWEEYIKDFEEFEEEDK